MSETEHEYKCEGCPAKEACQHAFGRYWHAKSQGGIGCSVGFGKLTQKAVEVTKVEEAPKAPETLKLQAESVKQPWEIAHVTKGRSAGIYCSSKRNNFGKSRQEVLCLR